MSKKQKTSDKKGAYKRLFSCMKPYKGRFILAILLILVANIAFASAPLLMGNATNSLALLLEGGKNPEALQSFFTFLILMICAY